MSVRRAWSWSRAAIRTGSSGRSIDLMRSDVGIGTNQPDFHAGPGPGRIVSLSAGWAQWMELTGAVTVASDAQLAALVYVGPVGLTTATQVQQRCRLVGSIGPGCHADVDVDKNNDDVLYAVLADEDLGASGAPTFTGRCGLLSVTVVVEEAGA